MCRFWSDRRGNIAILFGLAIMPLIGSVGVALDYSLASAYRTDLQKSLDATALALTKIMPAEQATLDEMGAQYLAANLGPNKLADLELEVDQSTQGVLKVSVTAVYTPVLANVLGVTSFPVGASAEAKWSTGKVEVALVLDNSGSMQSQGRMGELHKAAKSLVTVLENAVREDDDAKVAIIPFDARVNVGTGNVGESWIRWTEWDAANGSCSRSRYTSKSQCESNNGNWTPANHNTWNGCVWDRNQSGTPNRDVGDSAPNSNDSTKYPAWQCQHGLSYPGLVREMMPLSTDWDALRARVDAMQPSGYTNITIGLVWGWHALSSTPVMTEGVPYGTENLTKYIILLTDGDNTQSRHSSSSGTINGRTSAVCTNIKATEIKIYTIRLIAGNANLLRNCATSTDMYFDVQNAGELTAVFSAIGSEIANLHLSK